MSWLDEQGNYKTRRAARTLGLAAAVVLTGTVVAGCGDDDEGDAVSATTAETEVTAETEATEETEGTASAPTDDAGGSAAEQVTIDIVDIQQAFQPSTATATAGGEVMWVNGDDIPHTATAEDGTWDSGTLEPGAEFTFSADEPGTYPYVCSIHPSMQGELIVE